MNKIRVAIIGAGYMATEHAKAFSSFDEFAIKGFCSRSLEKATKLASDYNAQVFSTIEEMYQHTQADLVIIAVNELSLLDVCKQAFKYPWLCFIEKPVGYNYEEACLISKIAFEADHKPFVAFNRRSYSSTRIAKSYLNDADPYPRLVSILDQQDIEAALQMGQPELVAKNWMFANSIHLIDYFNVFCRGELISLTPTIPWNASKPSYVVATLQYDSGDIGVYQAVWNGPGPWSMSITNHDYRLEMRPLETLKIQKRGDRIINDVQINTVDLEFKPGLHFQAEQILGYFNGKDISLASLDDSLKSMKLCYQIYGLP
ncbi:Gfo/Idh/MocA family protein [Legionella waltersii]|nr:Gfo/Idh/MocA family oxidoreductase [Legionella waltersii]